MIYMGRASRIVRHHKGKAKPVVINLVAMIDMLTVLVFFLLVYSTEQIAVVPDSKDVQLPESIAETDISQHRGRHRRRAGHPRARQGDRAHRRDPSGRRRRHPGVCKRSSKRTRPTWCGSRRCPRKSGSRLARSRSWRTRSCRSCCCARSWPRRRRPATGSFARRPAEGVRPRVRNRREQL